MKNQMKGNNGITLIALVITIIVILILAGVTIATLTGDNGLLQKATNAKQANEESAICEQLKLVYAEYQIGHYSTEVDVEKSLKAIYGNNVSDVSFKNGNQKLIARVYGKLYQYDSQTGIAGEYIDPFNYGTKTKATVVPGDDITLGTEKFKVFSVSDNKIKAMPYYNLKLDSDPMKQATEETADTAGDARMVSNMYNIYWGSNCDEIDMSNPKNTIQKYIEDYKSTLVNMGLEDFEVRIPFLNDLNISGITNANRNPGKKEAFWLGTGSGGVLKGVNSSGGIANEVLWHIGGYRCSSDYYN